MITLIAGKVLRQVLLEARFLAATALVVVLFGIGSLIAVGRHGQVLKAYNQDLVRAQAESDLDQLLLVKSPHPLDFISGGGWWDLPRLLAAGPRGISEVAPEEFKGSFLIGFEDLDWVFLISVVLSLLAVFISHDVVSGEREEGTLRLILAQSVRRSSFLLGSALGLLLVLLIPFLLGLLLSLAVVLASSSYEIAPPDLGGILAVILFSVLYLALFVVLSILVSSLCRSSSTALIWLILFWVVTVVLLPGNGGVLAALIETPPQHRDEDEQIEQIERHYMVEVGDTYRLVRQIVDSGAEDAVIQRSLDQLRDRLVREQVQKIETRDSLIASLRDEFARRRMRQMLLRRWTTMASPAVLFRVGVERLLVSGDHDHRLFWGLAKEYWSTLREPLLRARERRVADAAPTISWETRYLGFSITGVLERSYDGLKPEGGAVPQFSYRRPSALSGLASAAWEWLALLALCAVLLLAALHVFARYDVR